MTPQQIVGLGVRLLAVWIAIRSVGIFIQNATAFRALDMADKAFNTGVLTAWWLAVALLLWLFPSGSRTSSFHEQDSRTS